MSEKKKNPISFNPDAMTLGQLKRCAHALYTLFDAVDREDVDDGNIRFHLRAERDYMLREWGKP